VIDVCDDFGQHNGAPYDIFQRRQTERDPMLCWHVQDVVAERKDDGSTDKHADAVYGERVDDVTEEQAA